MSKNLEAPLVILFVSIVFTLSFVTVASAFEMDSYQRDEIVNSSRFSGTFNDNYSERVIPNSYIVVYESQMMESSDVGTLSTADVSEKVTDSVEAFDSDNIVSEFETSFSGAHVEGVNSGQLNEIRDNEYVKEVYRDYKVETFTEDSKEEIGATDQVYEDYEWNGNTGLNGSDVRIAVLDTGVDYTHEVFGSCDNIDDCDKIYDGYDFFEDNDDPMDNHDHGTQVASIAAGSEVDDFDGGIAPEAKIGAYRVLDEEGQGRLSDIIGSIEYIREDSTPEPDIVSMSLGSPVYRNHIFSEIIEETIEEDDITFVVAIGNDGDLGTTSMPGNVDQVITVGATNSTEIADFSSGGPYVYYDEDEGDWVLNSKPEVVAPGVDIRSAISEGEDNYGRSDGTSFSTPMVSGAAALLLQKSDLSPQEVKSRLVNTADDLEKSEFYQGAGKLNIASAVKKSNLMVEGSTVSFSSDRVDELDDYHNLEFTVANETNMEDFDIELPERMNYYDEDLNSGEQRIEFNDSDFEVVDDEIIVNLNVTWDVNESVSYYDGYHTETLILKNGSKKWNVPISWFHGYPVSMRVSVADDTDILESEEGISAGLFKGDKDEDEWTSVDSLHSNDIYDTNLYDLPIGSWNTDADYMGMVSKLDTTEPILMANATNDTNTSEIVLNTSQTSSVEFPTRVNSQDSVIKTGFLGFGFEYAGDYGYLEQEYGPLKLHFSEQLPEETFFDAIYLSLDDVNPVHENPELTSIGYEDAVYGNYNLTRPDFDDTSNFEEDFTSPEFSVRYDSPFNITDLGTSGVGRRLFVHEIEAIGYILGAETDISGNFVDDVVVPLDRNYYTAGTDSSNFASFSTKFYNEDDEYVGELLPMEDDIDQVLDFQVYPLIPEMDYDSDISRLNLTGLCTSEEMCYWTDPERVDLDDAPSIRIGHTNESDYNETYHNLTYENRSLHENNTVKAYTPFTLQNKIEMRMSSLGDSVPKVESIDIPLVHEDKIDGQIELDKEADDVELKEWEGEWISVDNFTSTSEVNLSEVIGRDNGAVSLNLSIEKGETEYHLTFWNLSIYDSTDIDHEITEKGSDDIGIISLLEDHELEGDIGADNLNFIVENSSYRKGIPLDGTFDTTARGCPVEPLMEWSGSALNEPIDIYSDHEISDEVMIQSKDGVHIDDDTNNLSIDNNRCSGQVEFYHRIEGEEDWQKVMKDFDEEDETVDFEWHTGLDDYEIGDTVEWKVRVIADVNKGTDIKTFDIETDIEVGEQLEVGRETQALTSNNETFNITTDGDILYGEERYGQELKPESIYNITDVQSSETFADYNEIEDLFDTGEWSGSDEWFLNDNDSYSGEQHLSYETGSFESNQSNITYKPELDVESISFRFKVNSSEYIEDTNNSLEFSYGNESLELVNETRSDWMMYGANVSELDDLEFNWTVVEEDNDTNISYHIDDVTLGTSEEIYGLRFVPKNPGNYTIRQDKDYQKAEVHLPELYEDYVNQIDISDILVNETKQIRTLFYQVNISRVDMDDWVYTAGSDKDAIEFSPAEPGGNYSVKWFDQGNILNEVHFTGKPYIEPDIKYGLSEIEDVRESKVVFEGGDVEVDGIDSPDFYLHDGSPSYPYGEPNKNWECNDKCPEIMGSLESDDQTVTLENYKGSDDVDLLSYDSAELDIDVEGHERNVSLAILDEEEYFYEEEFNGSYSTEIPEDADLEWKVSRENDEMFTLGGIELSTADVDFSDGLEFETFHAEDETVGGNHFDYLYAVSLDQNYSESYIDSSIDPDEFYVCEEFNFTSEECIDSWSSDDYEDSMVLENRTEAFAMFVDEEEEDDDNGNGDAPVTTTDASVETLDVLSVNDETALLGGEVTVLEDIDEVEAYFKWRESDDEEWEKTSNQTVTSETSFNERIHMLDYDTQYEYKAVIEYDGETDTGDTVSFTTERDGPDVDNVLPEDGSVDHDTTVELVSDVNHPYNYEMDVTFYDANEDEVIEEFEDVNDGEISATWPALSHGTTYEWYVEVDDGSETTRSDTWSFETIAVQDIEEMNDKITQYSEDINVFEGAEYEEATDLLTEAENALAEDDYRTAREKLNQLQAMIPTDDDVTEDGFSFMFLVLILFVVLIVVLGVSFFMYRDQLTDMLGTEDDDELERYQERYMKVHSDAAAAIENDNVRDPEKVYQLLEEARVALDVEEDIEKFNDKIEQVVMALKR